MVELVGALKAVGIIRAEAVERAMLAVPRELFVWPGTEDRAYDDTPLPLGDTGQTISAPHMVALMLEELMPEPGDAVLEVGTGSGYNAALLAELVGEGTVITVERVAALADFARENLRRAGYMEPSVRVVIGDGTLGYPPRSTEELYDRIVVTAAAPRIPPFLVAQLRPGGILLAPVGPLAYQELTRVRKSPSGGLSEERLGACVFVPLVGEDGYSP